MAIRGLKRIGQVTSQERGTMITMALAVNAEGSSMPPFFLFQKETPTLLLLDNHGSHLSIDALDLAAENGVTLLSFPPHCSHRLQPLDVSVYGPTKTYYKSQCNAWHKNNADKVIEIRHIPGLVRDALDLALLQRNIKSGFASTGISPYNPNVFFR